MNVLSVSSLPSPLLLLIHLQILQCPHIDNKEYDIRIFDAQTHGLRARIKMMEDLGYWLVTKIEGKNTKKIFTTYPCIKPAETTAFRTSFAKYLDNLRQSSIKSNAPSSSWWRDVQTRKSLLEDCTGEKFLRLLLALSTHAFFTLLPNLSSRNYSTSFYLIRLVQVQISQRQWVETAAKLLEREQKLIDTKEQLGASTTSHSQSKYQSLSTERLIALKDSKLKDILSQESWKGESARRALEFLLHLTGIEIDRFQAQEGQESSARYTVQPYPKPKPLLLPIAAARHPSHLQKLKKPVFQMAKAELFAAKPKHPLELDHEKSGSSTRSPMDYATSALRNYCENEGHAHVALKLALENASLKGTKLRGRLEELRSKHQKKPKNNKMFSFWNYTAETGTSKEGQRDRLALDFDQQSWRSRHGAGSGVGNTSSLSDDIRRVLQRVSQSIATT